MNRRDFLKTMAGAAGVVIAPGIVSRAAAWVTVPTIYGDGIHDDAPGLQALIDGKEVRSLTKTAWRADNVIFMGGGTYLLKDSLRFKGGDGRLLMTGCTLKSESSPAITVVPPTGTELG
jgi:hypothetical protein